MTKRSGRDGGRTQLGVEKRGDGAQGAGEPHNLQFGHKDKLAADE